MRTVIAILLSTLALSATLLDFSYLNDAKEAYENKEYEKAEKLYQKVEGDEAKFNRADALYRQKKYKEALEIYSAISDEKLAFKKLHNMGNTQAQLGQIDEAIKHYEEALSIQDDEDTKFNLELLKKKKEEQKKSDQNQENNESKNNDQQNQKNQQNQGKQNKEQQQENNSSKEQKDKESEEQKKEDKKAQEAKKSEKKKKKEEEQQHAQISEQNQTQVPISNMEERKWQKMLNQRGVNTLMLPLNKGEQNNETNPW
ncbi:tetratricopeptide repeat protein [bacterium]|nr:tetratricopeptide repeat protein [bacterium]MBU1957708.1 tetratricopeptide repeat protein [bacterium]